MKKFSNAKASGKKKLTLLISFSIEILCFRAQMFQFRENLLSLALSSERKLIEWCCQWKIPLSCQFIPLLAQFTAQRQQLVCQSIAYQLFIMWILRNVKIELQVIHRSKALGFIIMKPFTCKINELVWCLLEISINVTRNSNFIDLSICQVCFPYQTSHRVKMIQCRIIRIIPGANATRVKLLFTLSINL